MSLRCLVVFVVIALVGCTADPATDRAATPTLVPPDPAADEAAEVMVPFTSSTGVGTPCTDGSDGYCAVGRHPAATDFEVPFDATTAHAELFWNASLPAAERLRFLIGEGEEVVARTTCASPCSIELMNGLRGPTAWVLAYPDNPGASAGEAISVRLLLRASVPT